MNLIAQIIVGGAIGFIAGYTLKTVLNMLK